MTESTSPAQNPATGTEGKDITVPLLLVLALLSALAPFATDLYLPAFPEMTGELATTATAVQLTLTSFLLGVTLGQLVFGPLSDRFGRVPPLIGGTVLCVAAGAVAVFAPTVGVLVAARFAQGLGGAAGMVIGRAIIADLASGKGAAKAFSLMMIVGGVAPVIAPMIGGFLVAPIGWRGILAVVLAISVVMLIAIVGVVRETRPPAAREAHDADAPSSWSVLRNGTFLAYTATFGFAFATMMAYISASPFVYQNMVGLNSVGYGLAFGLNALALMVVSGIAARLVSTHAVHDLVRVGLGVVGAATVVFAVLAFTGVPAWLLTIPLFVIVGGLGLVFGNATALAMAAVDAHAGGASAILGALQFGLAAIVSPLVGMRGENTAGPLAVTMVCTMAVAMGAFVIGRRTDRSIAEVDERESPVSLTD
jgi:DHA1 family bicyclomycin/chloramphenicol resistance-like MFS transporter